MKKATLYFCRWTLKKAYNWAYDFRGLDSVMSVQNDCCKNSWVLTSQIVQMGQRAHWEWQETFKAAKSPPSNIFPIAGPHTLIFHKQLLTKDQVFNCVGFMVCILFKQSQGKVRIFSCKCWLSTCQNLVLTRKQFSRHTCEGIPWLILLNWKDPS